MKLVITRSNLKTGLSVIEHAGGEISNLPILKNFLLDINDEKIKITTTNLEIGVHFSLSGKIIEKGKISVPISIFSNVINNITTERIHLEKKGNNLYIKTDNYEATIQGLPTEEFPLIPKIKNETEYLEIQQDVLKEIFQQVVTATQFSELRPELNSVFFDFSIDNIKIAATDSFRLAEKNISANKFKSTHTKNFKFLIPLKTIHELLRVLRDEKETVRISHDEHQVLFKTATTELISRLTEGNFPEYNSIIPKKFNTEATLNREEFLNAVKLTGVFSSQVNEVKIKALENKKAIEIFSNNQTVGENKYVLPAKIQGATKEIGFNWRYLIDGIKALKTENVFLGINEENKPAILRSPTDASFFYILMPILRA